MGQYVKVSKGHHLNLQSNNISMFQFDKRSLKNAIVGEQVEVKVPLPPTGIIIAPSYLHRSLGFIVRTIFCYKNQQKIIICLTFDLVTS